MRSLVSTPRPSARLNSPGARPGVPHVAMTLRPCAENFCTRSPSVYSLTNKLSFVSSAMERGLLNCPGPVPREPMISAWEKMELCNSAELAECASCFEQPVKAAMARNATNQAERAEAGLPLPLTEWSQGL